VIQAQQPWRILLRRPLSRLPPRARRRRSGLHPLLAPVWKGPLLLRPPPIPLHEGYVPRNRWLSHRPSLSQSRLLPGRLLPFLPRARFRRPLLLLFVLRNGCTPGSRSPLRWPSPLPFQGRYVSPFSFAIASVFSCNALLTIFFFSEPRPFRTPCV
jgi:hypothetical protein